MYLKLVTQKKNAMTLVTLLPFKTVFFEGSHVERGKSHLRHVTYNFLHSREPQHLLP